MEAAGIIGMEDRLDSHLFQKRESQIRLEVAGVYRRRNQLNVLHLVPELGHPVLELATSGLPKLSP